MFAETFQAAGCVFYDPWGFLIWTAGQRIDPGTAGSAFVWRVTTTDTYSDRLSTMAYTNWDQGQPNGPTTQGCLTLSSGRSYAWHDLFCTQAECSVCELDII